MRHFNKLSLAVVALLSTLAPQAFAVTAYDGITGAVDFAAVATGVVAIFALMAVAAVAMKGGRWVLKAIGGG